MTDTADNPTPPAESIGQCTGKILMGDQAIFYCSDCRKCECCTEDWEQTHGHLDYECFYDNDGRCVWVMHEGRPCKQPGSDRACG